MSGLKKTRVYLSKGKAGKTEDLNKVLSLLKQYNSIEVVMWDNSNGYDKRKHEELMSSCDIHLILPTIFPRSYTYHFNVGKGQYEEIMFGRKLNNPIISILTFNDDIYVSEELNKITVINEDWKLNYAVIIGKDRLRSLEESHLVFSKKEHAPEKKVIKPILACYKF